MSKPKLLQTEWPVVCRWLWRHYFYTPLLLAACALVFLPVGVVGGARLSHFIKTNQALAATRALAPEHPVLESLSESELSQYAGTLSAMVIDDPSAVYRLIGRDFEVMFRTPELVRQEGDILIWQYRTASCVLDLYFAPASQGDRHGKGAAAGTVSHYEVRPRQTALFAKAVSEQGPVDSASCFRELYAQRAI